MAAVLQITVPATPPHLRVKIMVGVAVVEYWPKVTKRSDRPSCI